MPPNSIPPLDYRVTKDGLLLLEHHGQFMAVLHSHSDHLPHLSQVFHSLQLNAVQLALAREYARKLAD